MYSWNCLVLSCERQQEKGFLQAACGCYVWVVVSFFFFMFTPGGDDPIWLAHIFQMGGEKPPTSCSILVLCWYTLGKDCQLKVKVGIPRTFLNVSDVILVVIFLLEKYPKLHPLKTYTPGSSNIAVAGKWTLWLKMYVFPIKNGGYYNIAMWSFTRGGCNGGVWRFFLSKDWFWLSSMWRNGLGKLFPSASKS